MVMRQLRIESLSSGGRGRRFESSLPDQLSACDPKIVSPHFSAPYSTPFGDTECAVRYSAAGFSGGSSTCVGPSCNSASSSSAFASIVSCAVS